MPPWQKIQIKLSVVKSPVLLLKNLKTSSVKFKSRKAGKKTEIFDEFTQFNSNNKCRYLLHYNLQKPINLKLTAMKVYVPEKL